MLPWLLTTVTVVFLLLVVSTITGSTTRLSESQCPLWHVERMGKCKCVSTLREYITCSRDTLVIHNNLCLTWDNQSDSIYASYCLSIPIDHAWCKANSYEILTKFTGPELNEWMCGELNRQGAQCKQCISGYGPAALSDGISCADCSKHRYLWILNLLMQLLCLTILFVAIMVLQIKGTASPWNIIITYSQLVVNALKYNVHTRNHIECYIDKRVNTALITILGVFNLDFLRLIIPPLCISSSLRAIDTLFFDYILALSPILMTILVYTLLELHDHNWRIIKILSLPLRKLLNHNCLQGRWHPKQSILSTFATFLLLSYSKLLFLSCNFLVTVQSSIVNRTGDIVNNTFLLYDPNIPYFRSKHIPYIIVALLVIAIFILLLPLLLLFCPTHLFRRLLTCCGFRRWDILHMIMDTFQGWYKDGTEGTYDYRPLSALYMLLRIGLVAEYLTVIGLNIYSSGELKWYLTGLMHVFLATFFLIAKPYKKQRMNIIDGFTLTFIGLCCIIIPQPWQNLF